MNLKGYRWKMSSILLGVLIGLMMSYLIDASFIIQEFLFGSLKNQKVVNVSINPPRKKGRLGFGRVELPPISSRRLCGRVAVENLPKLWKRNRAILDPHREVSKNITTTGSWALWLGDPQPGYLGKLGGDGPSAEELKLKSHIRVALPTVPRSGNLWFRDLWQKATGRTTGSVYVERGFFDIACSAWLKKDAGATPDCQNGEHVLVKSHTPFLPIDKNYLYDADFSNISYAINIIRNPFDNRRAWSKYTTIPILMQQFSYQWRAHHEFWESAGRMGLARYMLRYEDMLLDVEKEMRGALNAIPGKKLWTEEKLQTAVKERPPNWKFEQKCGQSLGDLSHEEMIFMKERFGGTMAKYGYFLDYEN